MKKTFAIDIHGVRSLGLEPWLQSYSEPLPYSSYQQIFDVVMAAFLKHLPKSSNYLVYSAILSNFKMIPGLAQQCFYHMRCLKLKEQGVDSVLSDSEMDIDSYMAQFKNGLVFFANDSQKQGSDRLRYYWWNLKANMHGSGLERIKNLIHLCHSDYVLLGDRTKKEVDFFCREHNCRAVTFYPQALAEARIDKTHRRHALLYQFCENMLSDIKEALPDAAGFVDKQITSDLEQTLWYSLKLLTNYFRFVIRNKRFLKSKKLLITHVGNQHYRLFGFAWKRIIGDVYTFAHGNNFINSYKTNPLFYISNMAMSDHFVVSSKGEAALIERAKKVFPFPIGQQTGTVFLHDCNRSIYDRLKRDLGPVKEVCRFMLIGTPFTYHYPAYHPGNNAMPLFHLEVRLLKMIKDNRMQTIYKAHPDTMADLGDLFDPLADNVETAPFESVMDTADCFIFTSHATTTFGYALLSNRPIILFYSRSYSWDPEVFELLSKRCTLIEITQDSDDLLQFDRTQFIEALNTISPDVDTAILDQYAF